MCQNVSELMEATNAAGVGKETSVAMAGSLKREVLKNFVNYCMNVQSVNKPVFVAKQ